MTRPWPSWKTAFTYMTRDPEWKRKLLVGGLWLIPFPVGWLVALGYRKAAIFGLIEGPEVALPVWRGRWRGFLADGMRAAGVILAYFMPFVLAYWILALESAGAAVAHWPELALFALGVVACPPLGLPFLPVYYAARYPWMELATAEALGLGLLFVTTTFLMPGAFLQVSLRGRFRPAFRVDRVLSFIARNARGYIYAWIVSLTATALTGLLGPGIFWGIFWSYLVIVYVFNDALFRSGTDDVRERFRRSAIWAIAPGPRRPTKG